MRRYLSLRSAIIIPYIIIMLVMLIAIGYVWQSNYQFLAQEQGTRIVRVLSDHTIERLSGFLGEPHRLNEMFTTVLSKKTSLSPYDLNYNQDFTLSFIRAQKKNLPQISVVSYGDENGRYLGYRQNDDGSFSLMRKDEKTQSQLNIYAGDTINSEIIASYEGYDPRTRPWYLPAKNNPVPQWSEIYINADEKNESTISTIAPIINQDKAFVGVAEIDVKLNGIHQFLAEDETKGTGTIYIVDHDWRLIAHSGSAATMKLIPGDTPTAELLKISESEDDLIRESARFILQPDSVMNQAKRILIDAKPFYVLANELNPNLNLGWKVIVAIPESDIMGTVKTNFQISIASLFFVITIGTLFGIIIMSQITKPMISVTKGALELSEGKWGMSLPMNKRPLYETFELVTAFNRMSAKIKDMLEQIQQMHSIEKDQLELAIQIKTEELKVTLIELMDREKLASLGSLVSGISHEINTPLGISVTAASFMEESNHKIEQLIQSNQMTKTDFVHYIENMQESVTILNNNLVRAAELIKSFKEIAVNQSTEEEMEFDFYEYMQSVIISLKHEFKHTEHRFEIICEQPLLVYSYPGIWSQIMTNFILNSLHHGFKEKKDGNIRIQVEKTSSTLMVYYSDNGAGIGADHLKRVFEPFYTTNRGAGGSGLGLNIVYNLVTGKLGGRIALESRENEGVLFTIEIPLKEQLGGRQ